MKHILYINYSIYFEAQQVEVLVKSNNEVNVMTRAFAAKLGLFTKPTNVGAQHIDGFALKTLNMTIMGFLI